MTLPAAGPSGTSKTTVYLDHAATTPMLPAAIEAMTEVFATVGNASSLHGSGRAARRRIEEARESIAADLGARPSEVIFVSGGTEGDNLAVKGIYWGRRAQDARRRRIIASAVEHHAVLDAVEWLVEHEGADVTWLPVDEVGRVDPRTLREALEAHADEVALVTVMWANNEVGTVMPIAGLAAVAAEFGVPIHSDAVQAVAHLPVDFAASGLSALTVAATNETCGPGHRTPRRSWAWPPPFDTRLPNYPRVLQNSNPYGMRSFPVSSEWFPARRSTVPSAPIGCRVMRISPSPGVKAIRC